MPEDILSTLQKPLGGAPTWVWAALGVGGLAWYLQRRQRGSGPSPSDSDLAAGDESSQLGSAGELATLTTQAAPMPYQAGDLYVTIGGQPGQPGGTGIILAKPAAPKTPVLLAKTNHSLTIGWSPVLTAAKYNVYMNGTLVATHLQDFHWQGGLKSGTSYRFSVSALNSAGPSPQSAPLTARTSL